MNIRKIIKEELDSFDWVNDVDITVPYVGMKFLGPTRASSLYSWSGAGGTQPVCTVVKVDEHMVTFWVAGNHHSKRPYKDFVNRLKKGIYKIVETMNESDFDWIEDTPLPDVYVGKEFTESPKFYINADDTVYHISKIEDVDGETMVWVMGDGLDRPVDMYISYIVDGFEKGEYLPVD